MVFYTAINPIVLIEFIDIRDISNLDARLSFLRASEMYCGFNHLQRCRRSAATRECAAIFHSPELFWVELRLGRRRRFAPFVIVLYRVSLSS